VLELAGVCVCGWMTALVTMICKCIYCNWVHIKWFRCGQPITSIIQVDQVGGGPRSACFVEGRLLLVTRICSRPQYLV
jgi:hypothetical protein